MPCRHQISSPCFIPKIILQSCVARGATPEPPTGSNQRVFGDAAMTGNTAVPRKMRKSFTWRDRKNGHCADMTQETETKAKAGAVIIPVTPCEKNCMLLWCEATKKAVVIDPGGDVPKIQAAITQSNVSVEKIWLTHGHIDHVGGAAELRDALK